MARRRVTVIDDSPELLALFDQALSEDGVDVTLLDGAASLLEIEDTSPDLLVVDLRLGSDSLPGWDIVHMVQADPVMRDTPIIVCSAALDHVRQYEDEANASPTTYLLPKPFSIYDLHEVLAEALGDRKLRTA